MIMFSLKVFKTDIMSLKRSDECWYLDNLLCIENEFVCWLVIHQ